MQTTMNIFFIQSIQTMMIRLLINLLPQVQKTKSILRSTLKSIPIFSWIYLLCVVSPQLYAKDDSNILERTFSVSAGGTLKLSTDNGDIKISIGDNNELKIKVLGLDPNDAKQVEMTQTGNMVFVNYSNRSSSARSFGMNWSWSNNKQGLVFDIQIPRGFSLDMKTSAGNLTTTDKIEGDLTFVTSGGDITLAIVDGLVKAKTSGGNIRISQLFKKADLKTSGGNIEITHSSSDIEVRTSGGDIKLGEIKGNTEAKTSGGDIIVDEIGGRAELATSGGDIRVRKISGEARLKTSGGDIEVKSAKGNVITKTSGGDLRLEGITGSLDASTSGGDIKAELIPSSTGTSRISSSGGSLKLFIPENAKAKIDALIKFWGLGNLGGYTITSDFGDTQIKKDENASDIRATYILNGGGHSISLETKEGNIDIRKMNK